MPIYRHKGGGVKIMIRTIKPNHSFEGNANSVVKFGLLGALL